ncbi:MAG TPA: hypothetical protein VME18_02505 [Acidobacteriaceae bacterium]|nr:hypothetical protein [Acidobacteriaceae bacterium]
MNKAEEIKEFLAGRRPIAPDDLPPFGARVVTQLGYIFEVIGWYGPATGHRDIDHERMGLGLLIESPGPTPNLPDGKLLFIGYFLESWIARSQPQRFPKFGRWMRESSISALLGRPWKEE